MFSQKLTVNDALDYILNDDSDFDDLEIEPQEYRWPKIDFDIL